MLEVELGALFLLSKHRATGCIPSPRIVLAALGPPRQDQGWNEVFHRFLSFVLTLILHFEKRLCYLFLVFGLSVLKLLYPHVQH